MKFALPMLRDWVQTDLSAEGVGDLLTMAGFELEGIEGEVLDIKVVSNRGDGLSVRGLAREVLAKGAGSPTPLYARSLGQFGEVALNEGSPASVRVEGEGCTRYACLTLEGVRNGEAPTWVRERLEAAGMRPISLLVDLTNYVMLELGQPLHAFDLDKLGPEVVVREAREGETLTTLDGKEHRLQPDMTVICDPGRPVAVAGVMGGLDTEVSAETTRCLLESAHFVNTSVRRTRKALGLSTEASYRFERSVDPEGVVGALRRFAELLRQAQPDVEIAAPVDQYPAPPASRTIPLRVDRASDLLGMRISDAEAKRYLEALGFELAGHGNPYVVVPPTWRPDVVREEDLVEELGRVHGYEHIPEALPTGHTVPAGVRGRHLLQERVTDRLLALGFTQAASHSLRAAHPLDAAGDRAGPRQPGSPDTALLRNSLLPGLGEALMRNGGREGFWFEVGRVFGPDERTQLGILALGPLLPAGVGEKEGAAADFYVLKAAVEEVLTAAGVRAEHAPGNDPRLHPYRQATAGPYGRFGQIHPDAAEAADLPAGTLLAELDLEAILSAEREEPALRPLSPFPSVRRDLSLLLDKGVPYAEVEAAIREAAGPLLERSFPFDLFEGAGIPEGKHALGVAIVLRKPNGTFTDEEANQVRERVAAALAGLGATTR